MTANKSYFVDPILDETVAGFVCYCFLNRRQIERRFFRDKNAAEEYGCDWLRSSYKMPS